MANERIKPGASVQEAIDAMSRGNPSAREVCIGLLVWGTHVDPDAKIGGLGMMGSLGYLLELDTLNIWGSRIYMLWSDVCGGDVAKMIAVLRAHQIGQLAGVTKEALQRAIDNRGKGIDLDAVVLAVQEQLPSFNPAAVTS